jgi:hypothetical protein
MKIDRSVIISFILLVLIASLYRVMPGRPFGFAPQIAMAIFGGSIISDKKYSFLLPLGSLLISDIIYQVLYKYGLTSIQGFYDGQWVNYLLFAGITVIGFFIKKNKVSSIFSGALIGATTYFILSNFIDWAAGGSDINNQPYPKTFAGLETCYGAAIPFYEWSLVATVLFSGIFFGVYYLVTRNSLQNKKAIA